MYTSSALKEPVQINYKFINYQALLWNIHEYQHFADIIVKIIFNPFHGTGLSLAILPKIHMKTRGYLLFLE